MENKEYRGQGPDTHNTFNTAGYKSKLNVPKIQNSHTFTSHNLPIWQAL